jgi:hypothetical protein
MSAVGVWDRLCMLRRRQGGVIEHGQRCWRWVVEGFRGCHLVDLKREVDTLFVIVEAIAR